MAHRRSACNRGFWRSRSLTRTRSKRLAFGSTGAVCTGACTASPAAMRAQPHSPALVVTGVFEGSETSEPAGCLRTPWPDLDRRDRRDVSAGALAFAFAFASAFAMSGSDPACSRSPCGVAPVAGYVCLKLQRCDVRHVVDRRHFGRARSIGVRFSRHTGCLYIRRSWPSLYRLLAAWTAPRQRHP